MLMIVASACDAEPQAAEAPLRLVAVRPVFPGVSRLSGDVKPRLCRIPTSPPVGAVASDADCNGDAKRCSAVGTAEASADGLTGFATVGGGVNGVNAAALAEALA